MVGFLFIMAEEEKPLEVILSETPTPDHPSIPLNQVFTGALNPWEIPEITLSEFRERYKRLERLGYGGQAEVFLVSERENEGQRYALKILPVGEKEKKEKRVFREAEALQRLDHSGIARNYALFFVKDEETNASYFYLLNQYVDGKTLADKIASKKSSYFSEERILKILTQCTSILDHAHQNGVIHSDIKPSNIKIDDMDNVVVLDWGISRLREELTRTLPSMVAGSPKYMAPEQMRGAGIVPETDYYGLGMSIVHLMLGDQQFNDPYIALDYKAAVRKTKYSDGLKERVIAMIDEDPQLRRSNNARQETPMKRDISLEAKLVINSGASILSAGSWFGMSHLFRVMFGYSDIIPVIAAAVGGILGMGFIYMYEKNVGGRKSKKQNDDELVQFVEWLKITVDRKLHPAKYSRFRDENEALEQLSKYEKKGDLDHKDFNYVADYLEHDSDNVRTKAIQILHHFSKDRLRCFFRVRKAIYERFEQPSFYQGISYVFETGEGGEVSDLVLKIIDYSDIHIIKPQVKEIADQYLSKNKHVDEARKRRLRALLE